MLSTEKILSIFECSGEGELHDSVLPSTPTFVGRGVASRTRLPTDMPTMLDMSSRPGDYRQIAQLKTQPKCMKYGENLHLEPVARTIVACGSVRGLGHVEETRTGVFDELVVEDLQADTIASPDFVSSSAVVGLGTFVATQVIAREDHFSLLYRA